MLARVSDDTGGCLEQSHAHDVAVTHTYCSMHSRRVEPSDHTRFCVRQRRDPRHPRLWLSCMRCRPGGGPAAGERRRTAINGHMVSPFLVEPVCDEPEYRLRRTQDGQRATLYVLPVYQSLPDRGAATRAECVGVLIPAGEGVLGLAASAPLVTMPSPAIVNCHFWLQAMRRPPMYIASRSPEVETSVARVSAHGHFTWPLLGNLYHKTRRNPVCR